MQELRVLPTVGEAYRFLLREAGTILRLSWLTLLLVTVVKNAILIFVLGTVAQVTGDPLGTVVTPAGLLGWILFWVVTAMGAAVVAVVLHRLILLGEWRSGEFLYLHFGRAEALFASLSLAAGFGFLLILLATILVLPASAAWWGFVLLSLLFVAAIYLAVRYSMIFPLIVMKGRWDFAQASQLTRGHFWRLFAIGFLVLLPPAILFSMLGRLVAFGSLAIDPIELEHYVMTTPTLIALAVLEFIKWLVMTALGVAAVSYSYKALSGRAADEILTPQS